MNPILRELQTLNRTLEGIAQELKSLVAIAQKIEPKRATFELKRTVEGLNSASFDVEYDHIGWDADINDHKNDAKHYFYGGGRAYGKSHAARKWAEETTRKIMMRDLHIEEDDQQSYQELEGWMK